MAPPEGLTADQRLALAREWDNLLAEVRELPGFEDFLRPPKLPELLTAAVEGPVVVLNVSRWRSDALIVTPEGVRSVPLPDLGLDEAHEHLGRHLASLAELEAAVTARAQAELALADGASYEAVTNAAMARHDHSRAVRACEEELGRTCGWLWSAAVEPVVVDLGLQPSNDPPRLWLCPTGPLTLLPLHAAGHGDTWLADHAVCSYTPTVRALVDARRPPPAAAATDRFLVVSALPGQNRTAGMLRQLTGSEVTEAETVSEVMAGLTSHPFAHFDCHADQDLDDPALGALRLADGVLRVFDLAALPLRGEYAALAACKSAVGGTSLLDEAITLAAALHYTGFRHVIGSLWILADQVAVNIFNDIYGELCLNEHFTPDGAARALANATRSQRRLGARIHTWAALVHIGP